MKSQEKLVVVVAILASFVAFLDGSVITVALPSMTDDLGGGLAVQQWIVDAYLITLGALILTAGSLSDLFGRKKILIAGLVGFGITSIMCAAAPNSTFLIVSRLLQGAAGALLVPSSLALITSYFSGPKQGKAIGTWTAWTGTAFIVGPLLGGLLVDAGSWRLIFAINILPIAVTLWLIGRLKITEPSGRDVQVDYAGAVLGAIGLGGPVYALIEQPKYGWDSPQILLPLILGIISLVLFVWYERRTPHAMLPLSLFREQNFLIGNVATIAIYAGLSVATFLISVFVQQVGGYSAVEAGLVLLPVTLIMFFLSSRFGALAGKYGPRAFMAAGPIIAGIGFLAMLNVDENVNFWTGILPGILIFGLGLSVTVAPLTAAVLGAVDPRHAGVASAVNNAVARIAGLAAIAVLGVVIGTSLDVSSFKQGVWMMAGLLIAGGIVSAFGITNTVHKKKA